MEQENSRINFIVITGAESTGKTQLASDLSERLNCLWVPELSRSYIEKLNRPYTFADIEYIAKKQIEQFLSIPNSTNKLVIFDTGLLITKVWFDVVYKTCPDWLIEAIKKLPKAWHLLCDTDLPWVADGVRENGGDMRAKLNNLYKTEMKNFGFPYQLVSGQGKNRLNNALKYLNDFKLTQFLPGM